MCSGGDILKVAALGALAAVAGPAVFGAAEGAGAIAGSEALASGVGAAGGDALGSLIASNAANWGVSVAPEIAALGGSAAELSALSSGSSSLPPGTGTAAKTALGSDAQVGTEAGNGLATAAKIAPLVSGGATIAQLMLGSGKQPASAAQGIPSPTAPAQSQAASTPAPNIFKKKLGALGDPTKTSGVSGVADITLGKATVLGQ